MHIVTILGSPRQGNSTGLARVFGDEARRLGATVATYCVNAMHARPCQACRACKGASETCVLPDDLTPVLGEVLEADALVLATPVYYGDVSAQMKVFIDRTHCFLKPDFITRPDPSRVPPGKSLVFIATQGQPGADDYADIWPRYEFFFDFYGYKDRHCIRGLGLNRPDDYSRDQDLLQRTLTAARQVAGRG
jgi:multimeric flavodoxin WrbA